MRVRGKVMYENHEQDIFIDCEVCGEEMIVYADLDIGDTIYCDECGAEFVIESDEPFTLSLLEMDDYDPEWQHDD